MWWLGDVGENVISRTGFVEASRTCHVSFQHILFSTSRGAACFINLEQPPPLGEVIDRGWPQELVDMPLKHQICLADCLSGRCWKYTSSWSLEKNGEKNHPRDFSDRDWTKNLWTHPGLDVRMNNGDQAPARKVIPQILQRIRATVVQPRNHIVRYQPYIHIT